MAISGDYYSEKFTSDFCQKARWQPEPTQMLPTTDDVRQCRNRAGLRSIWNNNSVTIGLLHCFQSLQVYWSQVSKFTPSLPLTNLKVYLSVTMLRPTVSLLNQVACLCTITHLIIVLGYCLDITLDCFLTIIFWHRNSLCIWLNV